MAYLKMDLLAHLSVILASESPEDIQLLKVRNTIGMSLWVGSEEMNPSESAISLEGAR